MLVNNELEAVPEFSGSDWETDENLPDRIADLWVEIWTLDLSEFDSDLRPSFVTDVDVCLLWRDGVDSVMFARSERSNVDQLVK
jgi:hypothetical protein